MAISDNTLVVVRNLTAHTVGFRDPITNRLYSFSARQPMKIEAGVLRNLSYSSGGMELLRNYLSVQNEELCEEFNVPADMIEYNWTQEDVDKMLLSGHIDDLSDALEFGPAGIVDMIVDRAISLELPDVHKREEIQRVTGRNITNMIAAAKTNDDEAATTATTRRRKSAATETAPKTRRKKATVAEPSETSETE